MKRLRVGSLLAGLVLMASPAFATSITIGGTGSNNVFPFGEPGYLGEYQQVYASTAFSSLLTITQVAFETGHAQARGVTSLSDLFTLGLGTTAATPAAPGTSYVGNRQPDFTSVFSGTVTDSAIGSGVFDFIINLSTPFTYNPLNGNLLLDVNIASDTSNGGPPVAFVFGPSADTGRVFNLSGNGPATAGPNEGLLTEITGVSSTSVPEPATLTLTALGLADIVRRARRRRAAR